MISPLLIKFCIWCEILIQLYFYSCSVVVLFSQHHLLKIFSLLHPIGWNLFWKIHRKRSKDLFLALNSIQLDWVFYSWNSWVNFFSFIIWFRACSPRDITGLSEAPSAPEPTVILPTYLWPSQSHWENTTGFVAARSYYGLSPSWIEWGTPPNPCQSTGKLHAQLPQTPGTVKT